MGMTIEEAKKLDYFLCSDCSSEHDAEQPLNTVHVSPSRELKVPILGALPPNPNPLMFQGRHEQNEQLNQQGQSQMDGYMSAIVPPRIGAANFSLNPVLLEILKDEGLFGGLHHEDPYSHLRNFLAVCALQHQYDVSEDALRLHLFPFSLQGEASDWLDNLPAMSIYTWGELTKVFLAKYFPPARTAELRMGILQFKQKPHESLHEAWDRYKLCIKKCPNHGCPNQLLLETFYLALDKVTRSVADNAANGAIVNLSVQDARVILDRISDNAHASYVGERGHS
ncbi:uncharacterized protein [Nicotiana tomentosiformis]|uniref:uncharacterized protein n=1 Tax=Nicotiana tomentosiformis TaxID=4098 RepID=UPI00051C4EC5|nr:uncharacterized protein LOC104100531 [Nicotiana tomentosiformis]